MDIVDPFTHLIPSDQLDDSLLIGQNLECEASNEFGPGLDELEDSLRNMLSDKDPMFGSASSQFNLLDNDDPNFHIAAAAVAKLEVEAVGEGLVAGGGQLPQVTTPVKRPVGRPRKHPPRPGATQGVARGALISCRSPGKPGRKPGTKTQKTFLIEPGATPAQVKRDLHRGGRIDLSALRMGLWLSPVVVLRRLTVTVGGFRIELLPGPSYTEGTGADGQAVCFEDGFSYDPGVEYAMLPDVDAQSATMEVPMAATGLSAVQALAESCVDDLPLGLGPYVNPNDVQAANGAVLGGPRLAPRKQNDQSSAQKPGPACRKKAPGKKPPPPVRKTNKVAVNNNKVAVNNNKVAIDNNKVAVNNNIGDKEQRVPVKKQVSLKQGRSSLVKSKLMSGRLGGTAKGLKGPQHPAPKSLLRGDPQALKALKQKQGLLSLKRRAESPSSLPASKIHRMPDGRRVPTKPKPLDPARPLAKRPLSSGGRPDGGHPGVPKPHSHAGPKPERPKPHHPAPDRPKPHHPAPDRPKPHHPAPERPKPHHPASEKPTSHPAPSGTPQKRATSSEDEGPEKPRVKKPFLQRQKSRSSRSISVEEPQLFVPDNAPVSVTAPPAGREPAEQANPDAVWDGTRTCGLCKQQNNNTLMVGCGRCDDWFHGDCVGLDLEKVQEIEKEDQVYVCLRCCAEETAREAAEAAAKQAKTETPNNKPAPPRQKLGSPLPLNSPGARPFRKDSVDRRQSTDAKDFYHKTGVPVKQDGRGKPSPAVSKAPSGNEIRRSVRDALKEILLKRLKEASLDVPEEKASELAKKTERELFHFHNDTDSKYKSKYRSLMFNLRDAKNNVLFKRVLKGEITPDILIRMSPEELASKELAAWRQRENRHTIEMIEKDQKEAERRPITKMTHKGEIEIEGQQPAKAPKPAVEERKSEEEPKPPEAPVELPLQMIIEGPSAKTTKDTTSLHKSHLFDLHCKICTGKMALPVEEAPTKVVKVATTVVKRQSAEGETKTADPLEDDLHITVLEESLLNAKAFPKARSDYSGREDETSFLAGLRSLWRGFLNMAAVAKMVTKMYPVSGVLDSLTEDLPDSIQVGGRISPQIVWDYLEKIRATGTKEVCLIRFSPETEEDEISYTLLYAYFSSRKRFGVVANNLKRVKDMYVIPLGAAEKVPHQLVPFDGPGLEANRPNLLLGLIIRQRPRRDFLPVDVNETARFIPETKPLPVSTTEAKAKKDEETSYLTSLTPSRHTKDAADKHKEPEDFMESNEDSPEKASESEEGGLHEPQKPLRLLPGVLRSWGGELPPLPDVWGKPLPGGDSSELAIPGLGNYPSTPPKPRLDRFVIKKKGAKLVKVEPEPSAPKPAEEPPAKNSLVKDVVVNHSPASISLKDAPSTPISLKDAPPTPISLKDAPSTPISPKATLPALVSPKDTLPALISLKDIPSTPIALKDTLPTPTSPKETPSTPITLKDTLPAPISLKDKPPGVSTEAILSGPPTTGSKDNSSPIAPDTSMTDTLPASICVKDKLPTPVSPKETLPTPIAQKDVPTTRISQEETPSTPVSQKDTAPTSISQKDTPPAPISLKDKPPDVSTEAFLSGLPTTGGKDNSSPIAPDKADASSEKPEEQKVTTLIGGTIESDASALPKPPPSGILKKCSAYPTTSEEKSPEVTSAVKTTSQPTPLDPPQPVPVLNTRTYPAPVAPHKPSHHRQPDYIPLEGSATHPQFGRGPNPNPGSYPPSNHGPHAPAYPPIHSGVPYPAPYPSYPPQLPPQAPANYGYPGAPPLAFSHPVPQTLNHTALWAPPGPAPPIVHPGPPLPASYSEPWEARARSHTPPSEDGSRRRRSESSRHGKKSRHRDREREKKGERRGSSSDKDKHRSRHRERKDRRHGDDHSGRHRDRHRHRKDSDHDKDRRRSSKDSHS